MIFTLCVQCYVLRERNHAPSVSTKTLRRDVAYEIEISKFRIACVSMASNVRRSVKTGAIAVAIMLQQVVRTDARSNLRIKESYDEIIQRTLGGQ
jgi:hypothetical protein